LSEGRISFFLPGEPLVDYEAQYYCQRGGAGMVSSPEAWWWCRFISSTWVLKDMGLVGFYFTLQAIFNSFLDFGLSVTITREIARYSVAPDKAAQTRDLVRSLEIVYWSIGLFLGVAVILGASFLAYHWLRPENIPPEAIRQVVVAMGIATIFQWPLTFYQGGLLGLQKMVLLNAVFIGFSTLRSVGAVLLLKMVSSTVMTFFGWQIITLLFQAFFMAIVLWRNLPASDHAPRFDKNVFVGIRRFMVGMSAHLLCDILRKHDGSGNSEQTFDPGIFGLLQPGHNF
jgi:O-antigen/teichoic acid export membrane protein